MKPVTQSDVARLDPSRMIDIDLFSEKTRNGSVRGICAEWAQNPPFYVVNSGLPQVVIGRFADVQEVLLDRDRFTSQPPRTPGYETFLYFNDLAMVGQMDGAEHDRIRQTMVASFSPKFMAQINEKVRGVIEDLLDKIAENGGPFDAMTDFADHLIRRILLDSLMGMSPDQQAAMVRMNHALSLVPHIAPGDPFPEEYLQAQRGAFQAVVDMVAERRRNPREHDFVTAMIRAQAEGGVINDMELVSNVFANTSGGQGTTAAAMGAMLMNLCKHRDQFDQIIADPSLIPQAVAECMRYQGAGFFTFPRFALADCEVGGTKILEGMPVNVSTLAANMDPAKFDEPLKLNIHRERRNDMTFGTGPHICLGIRLATLVLQIALERICVRFPNLRLQDPDFEPVYGGALGEIRAKSIPMHLGI